MAQLVKAVRTIDNLYRAWTVVRSNVIATGHDNFKAEVKKISENPIPHLRRLQSQLQRQRFVFDEQHGVLKKKSTGKKRPIVVASVNNRIVQRAILNVLQKEEQPFADNLGEIVSALRTPTSVGGIPKRGVPYGIGLVNDAIQAGTTHYLRSDIRDFFTKVPKSKIADFVRDQTGDDEFVDLLERAMKTELENAEEIKDDLYLFPTDDIGVPQGSSLSAFAGNVVLRYFDDQLNGRNIRTVRYIDDFVILGGSEQSVKRAFSSANAILKGLGMAAYGPDENPEKSNIGAISDGFDFIGCSIRSNGVMPSKKTRTKLLEDIQHTLRQGIQDIEQFASSEEPRRASEAFVQVLCRVDRKIRGWGDAFSFCDNRIPFEQMDVRIDELLLEFKGRANQVINKASAAGKRRGLGIALLKDTPRNVKEQKSGT